MQGTYPINQYVLWFFGGGYSDILRTQLQETSRAPFHGGPGLNSSILPALGSALHGRAVQFDLSEYTVLVGDPVLPPLQLLDSPALGFVTSSVGDREKTVGVRNRTDMGPLRWTLVLFCTSLFLQVLE